MANAVNNCLKIKLSHQKRSPRSFTTFTLVALEMCAYVLDGAVHNVVFLCASQTAARGAYCD